MFHQLLLLLRWEIFLCGDVLKVQRVMLIKWENFGALFVLTSQAENILTKEDVLSESDCM
jgi:hypothetical protein